MVVLQHEHSLSLVDLNSKYPHDEQVYDDEEDLIIKQAFQCSCACCEQKITYLHRFYYKCDKCDYSLHKLCQQIPTKLQHASHSAHSLTLFLDDSQEECDVCENTTQHKQLRYGCSRCMFNICLDCAMDEVQYHTIYHPSHRHPLIPGCGQRQILTKCDACGKKHEGVFYECPTCFRALIHNDCVFQPKRLLIQDSTRGRFSHTYPLILTYSFPIVHQKARFYPTCIICDGSFSDNENLWIHRCEKCRYYAHMNCVNTTSSNSKLHDDHSGGDVITFEEYRMIKDSLHVLDLPLHNLRGDVITFEEYKKIKDSLHVLDLPLHNLSDNIFTALFSKESSEMRITHNSHEHPLIFVDSRCNDITKVKNLCNGCDSPIMTMSFYKCANGCNFVRHECCIRLPTELKGHPSKDPELYHELHTIVLLPKADSGRGLRCEVCSEYFNGFAYHCATCLCSIEVWCALIPRLITHNSHPYHLFVKVRRRLDKDYCRLCLSGFTNTEETSFSCLLCNFHLHPKCALLLPETARHRYDKHPMSLSYRPVENHEGDYFCEVCEEEINPNGAFYHCHDCLQSMHTTCAPLLPLSKAHIHLHVKGVHEPIVRRRYVYKDFNEVIKIINRTVKNLIQITSSSRVPQGSSTSS